jgi:Holliday junction resolvase RusA-like endonuclease
LLSLNGREHWAERARRTQELKKAAWAVALQAKVPRLKRASIVVEYQPPDRRRRDADNPAPSAKACIDGIVAAGVLFDDACPQYVTDIRCTIGEPHPGGRIVLRVTEAPPLLAAGGAA